jgi:hypothetical protein
MPNTVTVTVCYCDLRGVPIERYASVLANLIGETYAQELRIHNIDVKLGTPTAVLFDGKPSKSRAAVDILAIARDITDPVSADGYFDMVDPRKSVRTAKPAGRDKLADAKAEIAGLRRENMRLRAWLRYIDTSESRRALRKNIAPPKVESDER